MKYCYNKQKGFTIIETMISISLFLVIVVIGMNALLNANVVQQKSQDMRSILDNLSFIMEDMSKNLRTGYKYHCYTGSVLIPADPNASDVAPLSCVSGWGVLFEPATGSTSNNSDQWIYYISSGKIWKATQGPYSNPPNFVQLNLDEIVLDSTSGFSVLGAEAPTGNNQQPLANIRLSGKINYKNVQTSFALQTSVSQRLVDVLP